MLYLQCDMLDSMPQHVDGTVREYNLSCGTEKTSLEPPIKIDTPVLVNIPRCRRCRPYSTRVQLASGCGIACVSKGKIKRIISL